MIGDNNHHTMQMILNKSSRIFSGVHLNGVWLFSECTMIFIENWFSCLCSTALNVNSESDRKSEAHRTREALKIRKSIESHEHRFDFFIFRSTKRRYSILASSPQPWPKKKKNMKRNVESW